MIDIRSPLKGVRDRERLATLGASFVAKVKATKVVWFPPAPVETGEEIASAVKEASGKATTTATTKTTGAARKTTTKSTGAAKKTTTKPTGAAKKATKKTTGAAKKATGGAKGVTAPRRKKTGS